MASILALIDGSRYGASVVDNASFAAERLSTGVDLVHVIGRRDLGSAPADLSGNLDFGEREELLRELAEHDERRAKLARKRGRAILSEAARRLAERGIDPVREDLVLNDLLETIDERGPKSDLIVIGKRGEAADFAKLHLGSNVERVIRHASVPVLIAARDFRPLRRVLVAFDGGPSITKAIGWLETSPFVKGAHCEVVCASERRTVPELDAAVARLAEAGYEATGHVVDGEPEEVVAHRAEQDDIDLVVLGASGHSRLRTFFVGSVSSEIIRRCMRPVLLFR